MPSNTFSAVTETFAGSPGVESARMFGSHGLKMNGKVFAMEVKGALVVKLSRARAEALVSDGMATMFDPGHGRPVKQWVSVLPMSHISWVELASEAAALATNA